MESDTHVHIQRVMEAQPGCFEIVQNAPGPSTRPVTMPLMAPIRQQNELYYNMMPPDVNSVSSGMAYASAMMPRTMPTAPTSGYAQYTDPHYPANGDFAYQLHGPGREQGYSFVDGAAYSAQAISMPTTQPYSTVTSVADNTAFPPASGYMTAGAFFGMASGMMTNGYQQRPQLGGMSMDRTMEEPEATEPAEPAAPGY